MRPSAVFSGVAVAFVGAVAAPRAGLAQSTDPSAAAELFRQGRAALEARNYPLACAKLRDSLRLDLRVGTLISLGECETATGKLASARLRMQRAAELARRTGDDRAPYCEAQFATLDARVPRLIIRVASDAPPGTFVREDGVDVGATELGVPLPVEVGTHQIVGLARSHDARSYEVDAVEGKTTEVTVQAGDLLDIPVAPEDEPPDFRARPVPAPVPARPSTTLRTAAYVAAALGFAGMGIGSYFGVKAISGKSGSPGHCAGNVCDATGVVVRREAIDAGDASTVAFGTSAALLAAGVVLYLASPGTGTAAVRVTATAGGAAVGLVEAW
jgi:serine/threonine-protein kinase